MRWTVSSGFDTLMMTLAHSVPWIEYALWGLATWTSMWASLPVIISLHRFRHHDEPSAHRMLHGPLQVLDEPAARQSDPTVLTLQLRQLSKEAPGAKAESMVGRIEHTGGCPL